ncbi:MAG: hypothetical protein Kow0042_03640 [Calditrichia bacterium]
MSKPAKLGIVIISIFTIYVIFVLTSNKGIGSFQTVRSGGEINQSIHVLVDKSKGFQKDGNGNIMAFYATDKDGEEAIVNLKEAAPAALANAEVVELFGHMHGNNFIAMWAKIKETSTE